MGPLGYSRDVVTERIAARVRRDFGVGADEILRRLESLQLPLIESQGPAGLERVQAAIVVLARGDAERFERDAKVAERDWRDVLVAAGLASFDWPGILDDELGEGEPWPS